MSKIEKALGRARRNRNMALVRLPAETGNAAPDSSGESRRDLATRGHSSVANRGSAAAAIAQMKELGLRGRDELAQLRIIAPEAGENATVQAFRELRTRILQRTEGRNAAILVTSAVAGGGSSFVTVNLGVAFAFDAGRTALVVDCNLRNPGLHRMLLDEQTTGITDYLENPDTDVGEIIHPVGIERLRVLPAGNKREIPAEYFTSARVRELFQTLRDRYAERFVLIDAPPMTDSADTQILVELCDYVLLVLPYGRITDVQVDQCLKAIDSRKLIGVVFNNEPRFPPVRLGRRDATMALRAAWLWIWAPLAAAVRRARRAVRGKDADPKKKA